MTTGSRTEGVRGIGSNGFIRTVGNLTVTGDLVVLGENRALAGTGSFFWEDADSNAEYWAFELPTGTSQHVPVLGVGVGLDGVDLGLFDGITQPTLAVIDADRDAFIALDFSGDDAARLRSNAAMTISTSTGDLTLDPAGNDVILLDGTALALGTDADSKLSWEVSDANAEYLAFALPAGTSTVVPVVGVGIGLDGVDLGLFNGVTQPTLAVLDADRDSFLAMDFSADDAAQLRSNRALAIKSGGGLTLTTSSLEDINIIFGGSIYTRDIDDSNAIRITIANEGNVTFSSTAIATISTAAGALTLDPTTIVVFSSIDAGVTANTNSTQGDNPITKMITQISVCANGGDAVTLPTAVAGAVVFVMNDGANAADVFPASSDNINEAGANTAYSLAADKNAMFIAHDATHWSVILTA